MAVRVWFTWETQRRNRTASQALNARLYEFDFGGPRTVRYCKAIGATVATLVRERPLVAFAQNPSLVLAVLMTTVGKIFGMPVVIDAHNAGIFPFEGRRWWANALASYVHRAAAITIVTNDALLRVVEEAGGRGAVLPDPVPDLSRPADSRKLSGEFNVLFICTWAEDEPYRELLEAAELVEPGVEFYVTGNSRGRELSIGRRVPPNVTLTGFVSENDFVGLLYSADLVVDLTKRENCLVCGAYEAVAVGTPMLLSGTPALREYFTRGALFTDNTPADIARQIESARIQHARLRDEIIGLKRELARRWERYRRALEEELESMANPGMGPKVIRDLGSASTRIERAGNR